MSFIHDDFLLQTDAARELYHTYARDEPIYDYHCHLPPQDVANNRRFSNLAEIWLEGDHYKWRAMRSNGVSEAYCTGEAEPYDKFLAWCRTVPHTLRNPLYHWSHLELKRYFDIDVLINEESAKEIWDAANEKLKSEDLSAHGILKNFKVKVVGTTDDPTDDLANHEVIRGQGLDTKVVPTFRPDKALNVDQAEQFNAWVDKLAGVVGSEISSLADLLSALKARHTFFHEMGGRLSDHGLERCYFAETSEVEVSAIFDKARGGSDASVAEKEAFAFYVMREVGRWNAERGWTMQLHVGAIRNNNARMFRNLGPDTGFDSIGDFPQVQTMSRFLNSLDTTGQLPKTVIYNLNWSDNYAMATMLGNFQDGTIAGKIQLGSGWWFLDQKEGMIAQMNALSNLGLLSRFVGMLTDSRSFLSYPRHEYFRRILCDLLGQDIVSGEVPNDLKLVGQMVKNICFGNADEYFGVLK
ncbi:glucuronate isomerase [Pelagicoccus sp. NFK12]|uniref:Uronate isomerase n=1 Tax=Pelagicoccus enzymogenes TaxID=2773457 RepID=A0A927F8R3_9BACT|nr:glucuronate isomerase [Pelagicoccus enzymogenes]MBD5780563.1 glucuronate isomerase [Pelagicoccus enzymogenes]MDQ8199036.1 glucuronate isomerase [Pelagicoccus enzymogenes]